MLKKVAVNVDVGLVGRSMLGVHHDLTELKIEMIRSTEYMASKCEIIRQIKCETEALIMAGNNTVEGQVKEISCYR